MVDEAETTFGSEHLRMDEYVFSARRVLSEGEKPKLELVIENPRVGLLSTLRKKYCWFSWDSNWGGTPNVIPLFFGRIVGIPTGLQDDVITVTFIAWPSDYRIQLQRLAETLKVAPFYDPVFTDVSHRDDPMSIFESYSKMTCIDPVTNVVTASDILDAEDGNVDFTEDDHFYDGMSVSPGAVPKTAIYVDATVSWNQTARGYLNMGSNQFIGFSADGILNEWPKPLSSIAPGLSVFSSSAEDLYGVDKAVTLTDSSQWTNKEKHHEDGDALSTSMSFSAPQLVAYDERLISYRSQTGLLDPFAVDSDGDPAPINIPASVQTTSAYAAVYNVVTTLVLEYNASRPHTERVVFILSADAQPTTLDPVVTEDSESIVISGSDVGVPLVDLLNYSAVAGQHVDIGTVIFPDDPQLPGGQTIQVVTVAGTAAIDEPTFSDIPGEETVDGGVTYVSLGVASPPESAGDWTGVSHVPAGTMILPRRPLYVRYDDYTLADRLRFPPSPSSFSAGTILQLNDGTFEVVTEDGIVSSQGTTATFVALSSLPDGSSYFVATTGGTTGAQYVIPPFGEAVNLNDTVTDGSVVWTKVATSVIPVGGTPGNVTASSFFCSDYGRTISIPHLICRARARLRYASRAVTTTFSCSYLQGTDLTLRKSVTLHDRRLPGGIVLGKVTGTELVADSGSFTCNVTIQSSVGNAVAIEEVAGDPTYVEVGYVSSGYQKYDNVVVLVPTLSDVAYTPLVATPDEDGITFPLEKSMIVVSEATLGNNGDAAQSAFDSMQTAASIPSGGSFDQQVATQNALTLLNANSLSANLAANPVWYDLVLKPLNGNGSFNHVYHVKCTVLSLPKMIDLESETTT